MYVCVYVHTFMCVSSLASVVLFGIPVFVRTYVCAYVRTCVRTCDHRHYILHYAVYSVYGMTQYKLNVLYALELT